MCVAALVGVLASACADARYDDALNPRRTTHSEQVFAVDPAVLSPGPGLTDSPLAGMRGVAPALSISDRFRQQILDVDPDVTALTGAAEGYDAVLLIALGAEAARNDAPAHIADRIVELSTVGKQCTDFRSCRHLIQTNIDVDYFGQSGDITMQPNGDPSEAGFGTIEFTRTGSLRTGTITPAQAPPSQAPAPLIDLNAPPPGDGVLRLGMLLPVTGPDGETGRAAQAGVRAAVEEINSAGGVLGAKVEVVEDRSGSGSTEEINAAVAALIADGVDAVIGGTTYDIDRVAVPLLTTAGILTFSPTDTNRALSTISDRGLFFRLAPPEDLEGQVLGTLVANDGNTQVAIVTTGAASELDTANDVTAAINALGGNVVATVTTTGGASGAAQIVSESGAQAVVIVAAVPQAAAVIKALIERGKGPSSFGVYGTVTNMTEQLVKAVGEK